MKAEGLTDIYGMTVLQLLGLTETGEWEAPSEVMLLLVPAEGMVVDATEQAPKFLNKYIGFGFKLMNYLGEEAGKVYVSDVNWTTAGSQERVNLLERAKVSEPILTVDGITPESKYFVQVAGVNGERESSFTTLVEVKGVAAPKNVSATVKSKEDLVYTAEWDDVKNADAGYRIRNYMVSEAKATESGRTVILESFKTDLTELKYVKDRTLDDYTDMPGWTVENRTDQAGYAKVGGNQLGGDGRAVLVSPELCLNNDNGEFTVEFTLRGNGNVALDVIAGDETQTVNLPWLYDWETNQEVYGEKKCKLTFNSGDIATRIRFTSSNWHAFSLSNLSVNQDINKGEYIYSLNNIIDAIPGSTSADIDNKALGENIFVCGVQSVMSNGDGSPYTSRVVMSPMVDFVSSSVGTMNITDITVGRTGRCIWISLPQEAEITVYSTDGTQVCRILGHEGINVTETLPSGIYAVRCHDKSFKIIL